MDVSYDYAYVCADAYAYVYAYTYVYVNVYAYVYAYVYASAYGYATAIFPLRDGQLSCEIHSKPNNKLSRHTAPSYNEAHGAQGIGHTPHNSSYGRIEPTSASTNNETYKQRLRHISCTHMCT